MKLLRLLLKPKWQHKDPAVRRDAVASADDAELHAALPDIARGDADAGVRLAALRRLDDYELWRERSTGDPDPALRRTAREIYIARLAGDGTDAPPLARRIAELDTLDADEIERIATTASDEFLRGTAQLRVTRPSLLVDRAANDPSPALRQAALARIDDVDALARIAERTRKTDKLISRLARTRLEAARIAAGDMATIEARARQLCGRAEALLAVARSERGEALAALASGWKDIAERAPVLLRDRFLATFTFLESDTEETARQRERLREERRELERLLGDATRLPADVIESHIAGADRLLADIAADLAERQAVEELLGRLMRELAARAAMAIAPIAIMETAAEGPTEEAPAGETVADLAPTLQPAAQTDAMLARARFDAEVAGLEAAKQRDRLRLTALRERLDADVAELEACIEAGDLAAASGVHARIETALAELPELARHGRRLQQAQKRFAELRRWQHWSNSERRKQLCAEIEALPGLGLHPDAVAHRIKEARAEWERLDRQEGITPNAEGASRAQGLARRFQALCAQALKPAKGYFSKRDELRKSQAEEIEQVLAAAEAAGNGEDEPGAWLAQRRTLADALRRLDGVEPRQRKLLAQRLKAALGRLDARIDAQAEDVASAKRRLIARAESAAKMDDVSAAARELQALQTQWKAAGKGRRRTDEELWKAFRAICDEVFGRLDGARQERQRRESQVRRDVEALLAELAALRDLPPAEARPLRRDLEQKFAALDSPPDRDVARCWQSVIGELDAAAEAAARRQRAALFHAIQTRLMLCREREHQPADAGRLVAAWQQAEPVPGPPGAALQTRFEAAGNSLPADVDAARDVLVRLEYLGGLETPDEDRQRRMDWQVTRLSQRMSQGAAPAPRDELLELLVRWIALGPLPPEDAGLDARFDRACTAAIGRLP